MSSCICLCSFTNTQVTYGGLAFGGDGIWSQSCVALPTTTIGVASVIFCLPILFLFSIVRALGTDWESLKMAFESADKSWGTCIPVEVVGWLGSTSVRGSV